MGRSRELGMCTFDWALFELYEQRVIGFEEAIRNADSANELRLNIKLRSKRGEPSAFGDGGGLSLDMGDDQSAAAPKVDPVEEMRKQTEARHKAEDEEMARLREKRRIAETQGR
jgi:twitching motility protein PilU